MPGHEGADRTEARHSNAQVSSRTRLRMKKGLSGSKTSVAPRCNRRRPGRSDVRARRSSHDRACAQLSPLTARRDLDRCASQPLVLRFYPGRGTRCLRTVFELRVCRPHGLPKLQEAVLALLCCPHRSAHETGRLCSRQAACSRRLVTHVVGVWSLRCTCSKLPRKRSCHVRFR